MRATSLALKDLLQIARDWKSALFLVVMPILFTFFFGLVLQPDSQAEADARLPVGIVGREAGGQLGAHLERLLAASEVIRPVPLSEAEADEAEALVDGGELAAAIAVPEGFSQAVLSGQSPRFTVIADPMTTTGQAASQGIETVISRLLGAVQTARISADEFAAAQGFETEGARQAYLMRGLDQAVAAWEEPPLTVRQEQAVVSGEPGESEVPGGFAQSSPGMIVQFAIFGLITSAMILVLERQAGALKRILTTPTSRAAVIGGHVLAMFLVVFAQVLLLVLVGQLLFGVDYMRAPLATLLMATILAFWAASLGLFIGSISKSQEQVITLSLIAMFLFAALGGAWFPLEVAGEAFATVGHIMPTAWAMDGFQNIVVRGLGLASVLLPAGILLAYGLVFFGLAVWQFGFETR
ncbi:MAG: ABC transporter permease [Anaerolineae bacterium]|nr:ABC transporter permease [Anaerolineae bacterium]